MANKLKTLKDIENKCLDCTPIFLTEGMRLEATRWIKEVRAEIAVAVFLEPCS